MVLVLHALAFWWLWSLRILPAPVDALALFVNLVAPPTPETSAPKPEPAPPKPRPMEKPQPRQLVVETPVLSAAEFVAPPPPPVPAVEVPAPPMPLPAGPMHLGSDLSAACPERTAPGYPPVSRRTGEEGTVVVRVELSETGHVVSAGISSPSGYPRLDEAAIAAVRTWRCIPASRGGQPVRATALQPFRFVLHGN